MATFCGFCGVPINEHHIYCCKCGRATAIKKSINETLDEGEETVPVPKRMNLSDFKEKREKDRQHFFTFKATSKKKVNANNDNTKQQKKTRSN